MAMLDRYSCKGSRKIDDFSCKDSTEYDTSTNLFRDAGEEASKELEAFEDTLYYKEKIPTRLHSKTHNSSRFLDTDYLSKRKMNSDTNALAELTEELMYGSTEDDLDNELIDGGVATEIAEILAKHGITGKAVSSTFKKLNNYYGVDPDVKNITAETEAAETEAAETEAAETEAPIDEARKLNAKFLETRKALKREIAIRNLKKALAENHKKSLKEALLVSPTGDARATLKTGRKVVGLIESEVSGLSDYQRDCIIDTIKCDYEDEQVCGYTDIYDCLCSDEDFLGVEDQAAEFYCELADLGPEGMLETYPDLDWSEDFVSRYSF